MIKIIGKRQVLMEGYNCNKCNRIYIPAPNKYTASTFVIKILLLQNNPIIKQEVCYLKG